MKWNTTCIDFIRYIFGFALLVWVAVQLASWMNTINYFLANGNWEHVFLFIIVIIFPLISAVFTIPYTYDWVSKKFHLKLTRKQHFVIILVPFLIALIYVATILWLFVEVMRQF